MLLLLPRYRGEGGGSSGDSRHSPIDDDIEDDDDDFEVDKDDTEEYDVDGTNKYHDYDSERTPSPPMCSCRTSSLLPFPPSLFPRRAGR